MVHFWKDIIGVVTNAISHVTNENEANLLGAISKFINPDETSNHYLNTWKLQKITETIISYR